MLECKFRLGSGSQLWVRIVHKLGQIRVGINSDIHTNAQTSIIGLKILWAQIRCCWAGLNKQRSMQKILYILVKIFKFWNLNENYFFLGLIICAPSLSFQPPTPGYFSFLWAYIFLSFLRLNPKPKVRNPSTVISSLTLFYSDDKEVPCPTFLLTLSLPRKSR